MSFAKEALKQVAVFAAVAFLKNKLTNGGMLSGLADDFDAIFGGDPSVDMPSEVPQDIVVPFTPGAPFYNFGQQQSPYPYYPGGGNAWYYQQYQPPIGGYPTYGYPTYPSFPQTPSLLSPWSSLLPTGSSTTAMSSAEALKDSYVKYGVQAGLLQANCISAAAPGQSQYHNCFFTYTNARGKTVTVNFTQAAAKIKAYQKTGRMA